MSRAWSLLAAAAVEMTVCGPQDHCRSDCKVYDLPSGCYSPAKLFPQDPQWGASDVLDSCNSTHVLRRFFNSTDGTCDDETSSFAAPLDECVGPFGDPRPWGFFTCPEQDSPECSCAEPCHLDGVVPHYSCFEINKTGVDQDCSSICPSWENVPWRRGATRVPSASVETAGSWSCSVPGALELATGGGTHFTVAYFPSNPTSAEPRQVVELAAAWAGAHGFASVPVRAALTFLWGCGPGCSANSALVNLTSPLARLKFGLMDHLAGQGMDVDTSLWGGTAHIQTVWRDVLQV